VSCASPGIARRRRGRGFEYLDERGRRVEDAELLDRIGALVIPPAWTDVWICPDPDGHLQAVGTDAAGRRQYLYHPRWRARRDQQKFDRMLDFARALPQVRRVVRRDLAGDDLTRDRVLACAVRLLDRGLFRVGSEEYAEANGSYGLATLERQHVSVEPRHRLVFDYTAKGGVRRVQAVRDREAHAVIAALKQRRGRGGKLLAYRNGRWKQVRSTDVNEYLKAAAGDEFTAKDFRTWHATVLAAVSLAAAPAAGSETAQKRTIAAVVADVAEHLGNTPAVCRASYIDPRVFDRYRAGATIARTLDGLDELEAAPAALQRRIELAVLQLLEDGDELKARAAARAGAARRDRRARRTPRRPGRRTAGSSGAAAGRS
jgi:DNA topoisomerase IB